jgi:hypothetical protein
VTIFDPLGLSALGGGSILAGYIFAQIEKRTVRISDTAASIRLPSHVDTEQLLFLVVGTGWILLAIFVFADRLSPDLQRFVRLGCGSSGLALIASYILCVLRLRRLGIFYPHDESYRPGQTKPTRARPRPGRHAPN